MNSLLDCNVVDFIILACVLSELCEQTTGYCGSLFRKISMCIMCAFSRQLLLKSISFYLDIICHFTSISFEMAIWYYIELTV